ncbi:MAG: S8 family peptidase [Muribaculaceae bacterium]|nr:S8 family peptidase [Muribaculaceae bacterium]
MATPAVTGAVALWLQANPNLTPQQIRDIIKETSVTDSFTGTVPNNSAGYGKLDSYAGLKKALETTGIDNIISDDSADKPKVWVESGSKNICCVVPSATTVGIYSVSGIMVGRHELNASLNTIDGSSLPSGVYILKFETSGSSAKIVL